MTEAEIESRAERMMDALDHRLLAGELTQADYDKEAAAIEDWAKRRLAKELDDSLPLVFPPNWRCVDGDGRTIAIIGAKAPKET
jgi:hypothetical protein